MSIINHSTTNINFAESTDVHVFPSAFRGAGFDPESRTQTERNFSHIGGAAPEQYTSYLIAFDKPAEGSSGYCEFVLGGYYFKVSLSGNDWSKTGGICTNKAIYASIQIAGYDLYSSTNSSVQDSVKKSTRLKNLTSESEDSDNNLDISYTPAGGTATTLFTGLGFYETAKTGDGWYCLQLTNADGTIHHDYNFFKNYHSIDELKDKDGKINNKTSSITMLDVMASMATNSFLFSSLGTYTQLSPNNDYAYGTLEVWKSDSSYIIARYTAKKTNTDADTNCRIWYGETQLDSSDALIWSGWKEIINAEDNQVLSGTKVVKSAAIDLSTGATAPGEDLYKFIDFRDKNTTEGDITSGNRIGLLGVRQQKNSGAYGLYGQIGDMAGISFIFRNDAFSLTPFVEGDPTGYNIDLGSDVTRWQTLYVNKIADTVLGTPGSSDNGKNRKIEYIFENSSNAVKHATYASKIGTIKDDNSTTVNQIGAANQLVYVNSSGVITAGKYINRSDDETSSYYAPTSGGTAGYTLVATGAKQAPSWLDVKINDAVFSSSNKTFYAPTTGAGDKQKAGQVLLSGGNNQTTEPVWSNGPKGSGAQFLYLDRNGVLTATTETIGDETQFVFLNEGTLTASISTVGTATQPVYLFCGILTQCSAYAGGTALTLNGTSQAASTASIYAPTTNGTAGQIVVSAGANKALVYKDLKINNKLLGSGATIYAPTAGGSTGHILIGNGTTNTPGWLKVLLNNAVFSTSNSSIYAPTTGGSGDGYFLKSAGSTAAPTWTNTIDGGTI